MNATARATSNAHIKMANGFSECSAVVVSATASIGKNAPQATAAPIISSFFMLFVSLVAWVTSNALFFRLFFDFTVPAKFRAYSGGSFNGRIRTPLKIALWQLLCRCGDCQCPDRITRPVKYRRSHAMQPLSPFCIVNCISALPNIGKDLL